jgi:hypothetical protein
MAALAHRTPAWLLGAMLAACSGSAREPATTTGDRSPCARLCEHLAACGPSAKFPGAAACTRDCENDPRQQGGACRAPRLAYERCAAELPCAELRREDDLDAAKRGPCGREIADVLACEPAPTWKPITFQF